VNYQQDDWSEWLPLAEFTYNNAIHEATGRTLFFLNHGQHPQAHPHDMVEAVNPAAQQFHDALTRTRELATKALIATKDAMKRCLD
jgi:hypothetical protein